MLILGVDCGFNGGLAWLSDAGLFTMPMPVIDRASGKGRQLDVATIHMFIAHSDPIPEIIVIETPQLRPTRWVKKGKEGKPDKEQGQGVVSGARFYGQGEFFRGLCVGMGLRYEFVHPAKWHKAIVGGKKGGKNAGEAKQKAAVYAQGRWPGHDFRASARCRKLHDGMVDAACIAEYGRRLLL